jgi:Fibronectin type III domain
VDQLGFQHTDYLNIGINKAPDKPTLVIDSYVNCSNKGSLQFYANGATSYHVQYGTVPGGPYPKSIIVPATSSRCAVPNLTNGTKYYYTVNAVNSAGTSPNANEVSQKVSNVGNYY